MKTSKNDGEGDVETLAALMLRADIFCGSVEAVIRENPCPQVDKKEALLKINQCRVILTKLQSLYENEQLTISNPAVRADVRYLSMALMWVAFHTRNVLEFKVFRMLVMIQSSFTYLLMTHLTQSQSKKDECESSEDLL